MLTLIVISMFIFGILTAIAAALCGVAWISEDAPKDVAGLTTATFLLCSFVLITLLLANNHIRELHEAKADCAEVSKP